MSFSFIHTAAMLFGLSNQPAYIPQRPPERAAAPPAVSEAMTAAIPAPAPLPAAPPQPPAAGIAAPAGGFPGGFVVHLASYRSEAAAQRGWAELRAHAPDLAKVEPRFLPTVLPDKGQWVRVAAGPFASRADAAGFCASLKGRVDYCRPLEMPPGTGGHPVR
ncbi:SPOR domain-containing protein [Azospirillum sp. sgz302134]